MGSVPVLVELSQVTEVFSQPDIHQLVFDTAGLQSLRCSHPDIHQLVFDTAGQRSGDWGVSPCHQLVFNTAGQKSSDWCCHGPDILFDTAGYSGLCDCGVLGLPKVFSQPWHSPASVWHCRATVRWQVFWHPDIHQLMFNTAGLWSGDWNVLTTLTFTS